MSGDQATRTAGTPRPVALEDLQRVGPVEWELPAAFRDDMRVPARIVADEELLTAMLTGESLTQLANVATLPGVVDRVYGMPDMHDGYGFPVGGVAATAMPDGVVSPGGVGFDINCGVRLLALPLLHAQCADRVEAFVHECSRAIATGTGRGGSWQLTERELDHVLQGGSAWVVRGAGRGLEGDLLHAESGGALPGADPDAVSPRAKARGSGQLGSLGAGNHFLEVQRIDQVVDAPVADALGLRAGQLTVLIHTGSRGLGHQVCTDYVARMDERLAQHGIVLPDRQLSCAPASSADGRAYLAAMAAAANFAWANRQVITHLVRMAAVRVLGVDGVAVRLIYDVAHNIAKLETHDGRLLCVHRKGATRAFAPGHPELPERYRAVGQPVFIPGSMGTASWVMVGGASGDRRDGRSATTRAFDSACHGAGRRLSRTAARRLVPGGELRRALEARGIVVRAGSSSGLAEEAPEAYKDVDRVAAVVEEAALARRVARLIPIGVVKG